MPRLLVFVPDLQGMRDFAGLIIGNRCKKKIRVIIIFSEKFCVIAAFGQCDDSSERGIFLESDHDLVADRLGEFNEFNDQKSVDTVLRIREGDENFAIRSPVNSLISLM